jgi:Flp pilus assembly protein TadD
MLTVGDPDEAVAYFQRTAAENPDRIDIRRGLAKSLVRADKPVQAVKAWEQVLALPGATNDDRVSMADAQIRANDWAGAKKTLSSIPPTHETYDRYRLEAMVADSEKQWNKADSFYETASGLTTKPSGIYNNWGFSKLTRGDAAGAEKLFKEALTYDPHRFTTKNNLVLARASQGKYELPVIEMTQAERAQLLYTAALAAIKRGDVTMGKSLLQDAIDTNPQYFAEADRALKALDAGPGATVKG